MGGESSAEDELQPRTQYLELFRFYLCYLYYVQDCSYPTDFNFIKHGQILEKSSQASDVG